MASELKGCAYCTKYLLFVFSFIFWLLGVTIFAVGIWVRADFKIEHIIEEMSLQYYWDSSYIIIVAGAIIMFIGFIGCTGSLRENPCLLSLYFLFLFIIFVLELAAAAYVFSVGLEGTSLSTFVKKKLDEAVDRYGNDVKARKILDTVQENLYCCGVQNWMDYENNNKIVPNSCRHQITGRQFEIGCLENVVEFVEEKTGVIGGVSLGICFIEIFGMIFSLYLCQSIRKADARIA